MADWLTAGEAARLRRRRLRLTQVALALAEGRSTYWVAQQEKAGLPLVKMRLYPGEKRWLARRRSGWTVKELARLQGISHVTLLKREAER